MTWRSDQALVEAARSRDLGAFDVLMARYERLVYRVAIHVVRDPEAAMDVVQTAFLKAYQALGTFRGEAEVRTWLLRIATREALDVRRRDPARRHAELDEEAPGLALEGPQEPAVLRRDDRARLARALGALNPRHRAAVVMRYLQDLPVAQVAQVLGASEDVTRNMLFRSVRTLREALTRAEATHV